MMDKPLSGRILRRKRKREKNQARKDERVSLFVTIRMVRGEIPELVKHKPNNWLRDYIDSGCREFYHDETISWK
jgi:hypothetical protein